MPGITFAMRAQHADALAIFDGAAHIENVQGDVPHAPSAPSREPREPQRPGSSVHSRRRALSFASYNHYNHAAEP